MTIRELRSDADVLNVFPLMHVLRDRIAAGTFLAEVRRQQSDGYRLIGGFVDGRAVVLAGIRRSHTLSRGEHLFVDDLVTDPSSRGAGLGRAMMQWVARDAAAQGLDRIYLDARITAKDFYAKLGFTFHTSIPCWVDTERLV